MMIIIIALIICTILLIFLVAVQHIMILTLIYYMTEKKIEISENDLKNVSKKVIYHIIKDLI